MRIADCYNHSIYFILLLFCLALTGVGKHTKAHGAGAPRTKLGSINSWQGIYAISGPLHTPGQNLPFSFFQTPEIDGVYIRLLWSTLEPSPGQYQWQTLDQAISLALAAQKKLTLSVRAGSHSPQWLQTQDHIPSWPFIVGPHGGTTGRCDSVLIPSPWDATYLNRYGQFMQALSQHLQSIPGAYSLVQIIKIAGINQETEELRLPAATTTVHLPGCTLTDATQVWQEAGYRPNLIVSAWIQIATQIQTVFPDKILGIEILQNNAFPPINNQGFVVRTSDPSYVDVTQSIIHEGIRRLTPRFAVQWDGLNSLSVSEKVLQAGKAGAIVGWQSNQFLGPSGGAGCGGNTVQTAQPCNNTSYQALLDFGIDMQGRYLELWPPNIIQFPNAVAQAQSLLQHLPLKGPERLF